ncbi:cdk4 [Symbiodinium pilosum]|uniref:Cdk4 protein n=1 Tax=Symbiodinium pilosum TaxID=2952 RepID=A0A812UIJ4_SYMPI|nr:cdk4 [Symbiodinium pilosum]
MALEDSSDDEYWGSYTTAPQERFTIPQLTQPCRPERPWLDQRDSENLAEGGLPEKEVWGGSSLSTTCSQDATEMQADAVISVENRTFTLHDLLGFGSFGSVWRASCIASGKIVALKEVRSSSHDATEAAMLEAQRLRALRNVIEEDDTACAALPFLLCAGTVVTSTDHRTLLVMEHIPGAPLQQALEAGQLCAGRMHPLAQAFRVAGQMLSQISAAMFHVSKCFFHRDANPHNIMVQVMTGKFRFGLIDFGLAVDSAQWSAGGWRTAGAAGDGRFWTESSWLLFSHGSEALAIAEDLQSEYACMIDLHSAGLSVLQTLLVLAFGEEGSLVATMWKEEAEVFLALESLVNVWKQYWRYASDKWQEVLDAFNQDARADVKSKLAQELAHSVFGAYFHRLRAALEQVLASLKSFCANPGGSCQLGSADLALRVIEALLLMISAGRPRRGRAGWKEVKELFAEV